MVVSLFFMFFMAAVEFARVSMAHGTLGNAAYEGARVAIVPGATADEARSAAQQLVDAALLRSAQITIDPAALTPDTTEVTVTVTVDMDANGWLVLPKFTRGMQISRSRTLAREQFIQEVAASIPGDNDASPGTDPWDRGGQGGRAGSGGWGRGGWGRGGAPRGGRGGRR